MNRWIGISVVTLLLLLGSFLFPQAANSPVLIAINNLSDVTSVSSARTNLGLGTAATQSTGTFSQVANNLSDLNSAATSRTNLGLGTAAVQNVGTFFQVSNNLSEGTAATMRTSLGLGTAALVSSTCSGTAGGTLPACTASHVLAGNGTVQTIAAGATGFLSLSTVNGSANEVRGQYLLPFAGTATIFYLVTTTTQSAGGALVCTVRIATGGTGAGTNSTLAISIAASTVAGRFTDSHNATFAAGDALSIGCVNNGSGLSAQLAGWGIGLVI